MEKKSRRSYSKEYKTNAVKLILEQGRKTTEVARQLGVSENTLHNWKRQYKQDHSDAFPGHGNMKTKDEYIRRLERENKRLKEEREILKKATAFFAKEK